MTGIFVDNGVDATSARNAQRNPQMVDGCAAAYYSTTRCQSRFDPAQANAVISEMVNLVNCAGLSYDCTALNNLCTAVDRIWDNKMFGCMAQTFPDTTGACQVERLVLATDAAGCSRIARFTEASNQITQVSNNSVVGNNFPPQPRPTDPTNPGGFYNRDELVADIQNNTVNNGKLGPNHLFHAEFTIACDGTYEIEFDQQVIFNPGQNGGAGALSELAVRVDGVWQIYPNGIPLITQSFTNYVDRATLEGLTFQFAAGNHVLDAYVIARSAALPPAQAQFVGSATTTGGVMTVTRALG